MTLFEIDINLRLGKIATYVGFEDCRNGSLDDVCVGNPVNLYSEIAPGHQLAGEGLVTAIDREKMLVYLDVDWSCFKLNP